MKIKNVFFLAIIAVGIVCRANLVMASTLTPAENRAVRSAIGGCEAVVRGNSGLLRLVLGADPDIEPILFRQRQVGERYQFDFEDRFSIRLDHVHPESRPQRVVVEISAPTASLRLAPLLFVGLDQNCRVQQARRLRYKNDVALELTLLNPKFEQIDAEPLNPALPGPADTVANAGEPPGAGKVLVALVDSGVNYLLPEIQRHLARDVKGNLLGYDFWDLDDRPFDANPPGSPFFVQRHGTRTASILLQESVDASLVPYRYPRPDMARLRPLVEHADSLGVRIIGMPLGSTRRADWLEFESAARAHPHILFIVSAGNNGNDIDEMPVYPAAMQIDNMVVVTSADDFARPAERTNWGSISVDYLVPAEQLQALDFSGQVRRVSGSSYAVSRTVALAANLLAINPALDTRRLQQSIQDMALTENMHDYVSKGYIADPLSIISDIGFEFVEGASSVGNQEEQINFLALSLLLLDQRWKLPDIHAALEHADEILSVCGIHLGAREAYRVLGPDHIKDLSTGAAHSVLTAFDGFRSRSGNIEQREISLVFARNSRMAQAYEAEAFGEGNTRRRRWMQNSVWVTHGARDLGITLAHEIFHILINNGDHTSLSGNLMTADTSGDNTGITRFQCEAARKYFAGQDGV